MSKYDELVERLNARIEKQRSEHGNYFYNGVVDPELAKAAAAIITLEAELAAMKARGDRLAEALDLAANRLHRCCVDYETGTRQFIEVGEWAADARQALTEWRDQHHGGNDADIPQEVREAAQSIEWVETLIDDQAAIQHEFYKVWLAGKRAGMERAAEIAEQRAITQRALGKPEDWPEQGWNARQVGIVNALEHIAQAIRSENDA